MNPAHRVTVIVDSMAVALHKGLRWLQAASVDVIRLRPAEAHVLPAAAQRQDRTLAGALARWSTRIQRWRGLVLLRRHLLVAVCLAIVLQILNLTTGLSELVLLAAPCLLLAGIAVELPRGPGLAQVAGLLDEQIGLYDLIGTGFELQAHAAGAMRPLEERALEQAAGEASGSLGAWRARPAPAGGEWSTLLVGLAALSVLLALAPSHVGTGRSAVGGATAQAGSARSAHHASSKATASATGAKAPAPASAPAYHAANGTTRKGFQTPTRAASKPGSSSPAKTGGALKATSRTSAGAGKPAGAKAAPGAAGQTGSRTGADTGVSPVSAAQLAARTPNATPTAALGTPSTRSHASSPTSSTGQRTGSAGSPTGTSSAGHARGSTRLGGSHTLTGSVSKSLPLKAGYAPARKGATSANRVGNGPGGGGRGRSQEVEGSADAGGGGATSFVPSDGGAVAAAGSGSLISYLASLQWVQEQPW
jgi:hypothetical protein